MNEMKKRIIILFKNQSLPLYFVITFMFSWICWMIAKSIKNQEYLLNPSWLIAQVGVFAPSITAVFFSYFNKRKISIGKFMLYIFIYVSLILLGVSVIQFKPEDLTFLPNWFGYLVVFIAAAVFIFFLFQRQVLYTAQKKMLSSSRLFGVLLFSWLFYPFIFFAIWIILHFIVGNPSLSILGSRSPSIIFLVMLTISFDFLYGGSFGEELGWRGYALPLLLKRYHPMRASLVLGIIWSMWHLPLDLTAGFGVQGIGGVFLRILTVCPMSIIFTWFYLRFHNGITTSLLLHSGINIIPALGLSNYETAFGLLIVFQLAISIFILTKDPIFRKETPKFNIQDNR